MAVAIYAQQFHLSPDEMRKGPEEWRKAVEQMAMVVKKHGLTDDDIRQVIEKQPNFPADTFDHPLLRQIKDIPGFNAEMYSIISGVLPVKKRAEQMWTGVRLTNVKIEGDQAAAAVQHASGHSEAIEFRRIQGVWRLRFPCPPESR